MLPRLPPGARRVSVPWTAPDDTECTVDGYLTREIPARLYGNCPEPGEPSEFCPLAVYDESGTERPDLLTAAERADLTAEALSQFDEYDGPDTRAEAMGVR